MKEIEKEHDNQKINDLRKQIKELILDYEDMIKSREEAKKQLEGKFEDTFRRINATKEFAMTESKRILDIIKAFQSKFDFELFRLEKNTNSNFDSFQLQADQSFNLIEQHLNTFEKLIQEEKEERIRDSNAKLNPIKEKIRLLEENCEIEKSIRIEQKKELLQKVSDEKFKITEALDKEITEKNIKQCQLKDSFRNEINKNIKFVEQFQKEMLERNSNMKIEIDQEINQRFSHQDEIINNISIFLNTFQDTLKVISNNS